VLNNTEFCIETKIPAIIAVGDMCLAIEEDFSTYLDETMNCLFIACQQTLNPPQNLESEESIVKLRDSIIDAFISIVHGIQGMVVGPTDKKLQGYAKNILQYIDALLNLPKLNVNDEFVKSIYELFIDVSDYFGDYIQGSMREISAPRILREGLNNFRFPGIDSVRDRFLYSMTKVGCM
jgi:hypothetical protein